MSGDRIEALIQRRERSNPCGKFVLEGRDRKYRFEEASAVRDVWIEDGKQPSSLRQRIDLAEQDLQDRVHAAQALYGGGMDRSRYLGPAAAESRKLHSFSTQAELRDERMMLQQQLVECVERPAYQEQPVEQVVGKNYQELITPASAWELNRNLSEAASSCREASTRLQEASHSLTEQCQQLHEDLDKADLEADELEHAASLAIETAAEARYRAGALKESLKVEEAQLRSHVLLADQAVANAESEYEEIKLQCDLMSKSLTLDKDDPKEDKERTKYHMAARLQRDTMHGPPGVW